MTTHCRLSSEKPSDCWAEGRATFTVWRRLLVIALDGLRPDRRRPSPMPVPPLDDDEICCAMRSWGERRRR